MKKPERWVPTRYAVTVTRIEYAPDGDWRSDHIIGRARYEIGERESLAEALADAEHQCAMWGWLKDATKADKE